MFVLQIYMILCNYKRDIYFDELINNKKKENRNFVFIIYFKCEFMFFVNY